MNEDFISCFMKATVKVLDIQAGLKVQPLEPVLRKSSSLYAGDVTGFIAISSNGYTGSFLICFPEATFLKVMGKMLGENYTSISKEILDGTAELTNMIFGQAKITLNEKGHGIEMAFPQITQSVPTFNGRSLIIPFKSDSGDFFIEFARDQISQVA
jgi:CheY-specific phosphatase CheX